MLHLLPLRGSFFEESVGYDLDSFSQKNTCDLKNSSFNFDKDDSLFDEALELIKKKNALLIAHYYTSDTMQRLCEAAGGFIGDSLEMARVGRDSDKNLLLVAGVRFMGETAKILSPDKTVIMPDLKAECSLDLCCDVEDLKRMKSLRMMTPLKKSLKRHQKIHQIAIQIQMNLILTILLKMIIQKMIKFLYHQ